ncbi:MAG: phosphate/phosphite/phosphonate ABC transporter substrate-binding protein [Peptoniphilus sp.]|nr:phosphate/phosphite/phosphonate ABC transporter substrate-binding protein [Peptoniphilus sp.]
MKSKTKKLSVIAIIGLLLLSLAACSGENKEKSSSQDTKVEATEQTKEDMVIEFGLAPDEDTAAILRKYEPFIDYLEEETGYTIKPYVGADYTAVIQAMDSDHLDAAWFGPSEYVLATDQVKSGVEAFAKAVQTEDSIKYRTSFVVKAGSEYKSMEDLKGKTLAFTDPASTSGHIFGRYSLVEENIVPEEYFENVIYAGSHDAALLSVINDEVDVAAVSSRKIPGFIESGVIEEGDISIIYESVEIPADPLTYRNNLPEEVKTALKDALINNPEKVKEVLSGTEFSHFEEAKDEDYDLVRNAYKVAGLEPEL